MSKTYSLVALLDVLGYKNQINSDRSSGNEAFKKKLEAALAVLTTINETEIVYQAISDTIIIAANASTQLSEFIRTIAIVQRAFLKNGLLIRGGVAFEQHFKSGNLTYSHALAIAHELEQKQAVYPRIVVDKSVFQMIQSGTKFSLEDLKKLEDEKMICVQNGIHFVNSAMIDLDEYFQNARSIFLTEKEQLDSNEHELAKHRWLQDYMIALSGNKLTPYMGSIDFFVLPAADQVAA
jgi:hypothetical protein